MEKDHKVLILKTGYSEFLDERNNSRTVSYGDILRTTPILHLYEKENVTWVTDQKAFPLLEGNSLINKLLPYDFITASQLESEEFDTVINLEKTPGICALTDRMNAWKRHGFRFNTKSGEAEAYDNAFEVLAFGADPKLKKQNEKTSQELLFGLVGEKWAEEEYVLGYKPKTDEIYDVALNTNVGSKWPTKAWPQKSWDGLEKRLIKEGLSVTRQDKQEGPVLNDLNSYMDWLNSAKMIVSNDSLGMHLGIALKKKVLGLFGPTPHKEVYFYNRGEAILCPTKKECLPCFNGKCSNESYCMDEISPQQVLDKILEHRI